MRFAFKCTSAMCKEIEIKYDDLVARNASVSMVVPTAESGVRRSVRVGAFDRNLASVAMNIFIFNLLRRNLINCVKIMLEQRVLLFNTKMLYSRQLLS
jgi:hypothetical protein